MTRRCAAYWCEAETDKGTVLCYRHEQVLDPSVRVAVRAVLAAAVQSVAAAQMSLAFSTLPQEIKDRLTVEARKL